MDRKKVFLLVKSIILEQIKVSKRLTIESQNEANFHKGAMESRYDTFKEEAQYRVANSQKRTEELYREYDILTGFIKMLDNFELSNFVKMGSIVFVTRPESKEIIYLVSPVGGGLRVEVDKKVVIVVTLRAPLCKRMFAKKVGDEFSIVIQNNKINYKINKIL